MMSAISAPSMSDPADLATRLPCPSRVRQFAATDPGQALALAIGCAWAERGRGGHAIAIVPEGQRGAPLVRAGLDLAARLELGNLSLRAEIDPALPLERLAARERQPVRLATLGRSLRPPWPEGDARSALGWLAEREPRLLLPGRDPRWGVDAAALLALAWIAGEGRRVVWELPASADPSAWGPTLELIGRMQVPLKLVCPHAALPWPPAEHGLARWWVAAAGGAEASAVLAWALAGEECCLVALDGPPVPGWPADGAWTPGAPRRLVEGGPATLVCTAAHTLAALAAAEASGCGVLQLTGIVPLPLCALRRAVAAGPMLVMGEELARHLALLARADPGLRFQLVPADAAGAALIATGGASRRPIPIS